MDLRIRPSPHGEVAESDPAADEEDPARAGAEVEDTTAEILAAQRAGEVDERLAAQPELTAVRVPAEGRRERAVADRPQPVGRVHEHEPNACGTVEGRFGVGRALFRVVEEKEESRIAPYLPAYHLLHLQLP